LVEPEDWDKTHLGHAGQELIAHLVLQALEAKD
jgi:lysophospholipase L1-like esterase